jgi:hypothetical protein
MHNFLIRHTVLKNLGLQAVQKDLRGEARERNGVLE